ncbi:2-(1,2-epoxy-1,2-dihydrophenyl)acetyl-CoA isomerase [Hymenobacter taeanensis]|uniref:2-(1,2-epoxy-1,2-dihydrophenyl)acetyl-CoA isomerase n=1 Tax=Hymenobacter taeanensis TaxID=2735321 RepID=A0A6M6BJV2_9BACT|nr:MULTISPECIES: enoyl-CoA hydratase-related protein [Hymenobacter]QJX48104.1 2-(1,2-epoxy-1,2-dihydrophenyl)acetyl-CoA isomerase [Hymenobacter taeanensis]UOQ82429.1 enoyl-CoA hydratase-related protein [Hymenobacter sp. 5414T-23]
MPETSFLNFTIEAGVATLTLNRPDVFNSVNKPLALALQQYLRECQQNPEVRAVLLTGTGKAFCAGQDLAEITGPDSPEVAEIVEKHYNPIVQLIRELDKPVVAAVNGVAAGAGANLALACDIVVAKESASFIQAFSKIGLIPDSGGTYFLPRLIGLQRAAALMFTGDKVSAQEAVQMGMIYKAFPDESFDTEVAALVSKLAAMPTKGLAYTKQLLNTTFGNDLTQQLRAEADYQLRAGHTTDYREGVSAFMEKRKPTFTGQ